MNKPAVTAWLITPFAADITLSHLSPIASSDLIIAIDNGLSNCLRHNLKPDILIGDLDSLDPLLQSKLPATCQILQHPTEKDETDTQLAVEYCLEHDIHRINICNDMTGRFDHAMGIIQNLMQTQQAGSNATIYTGSQQIMILDGSTILDFPQHSLISLIALSGIAVFLASQGLAYPLDNLTLYPWQSRGISNEFTASHATIRLVQGTVLAIITPA